MRFLGFARNDMNHMNQRVVIFGNGELHNNFLKEVRPHDFIIGVDRAAYWLLSRGVTPAVAIGDFDSTTKEEFASITKSIKIVKTYKQEKDFTDMELAIRYAKKIHPKETIVFGATGRRLDHTLANLHLLESQILIDSHNRIRWISRGKTIIEKSSYRYVSILPDTKSITISLTGFRYDISRKVIKKGTSLGVSNELVGGKGIIQIFSGRAWVIESND